MSIDIFTRPRNAAVPTTLNEVQRNHLYQLTLHQGWPVLLQLMEMFCLVQDAALYSVDPGDERKVIAEHRIGLATWNLYDKVQNQVKYEVNELLGNKAEAREATEDQGAVLGE